MYSAKHCEAGQLGMQQSDSHQKRNLGDIRHNMEADQFGAFVVTRLWNQEKAAFVT